MENQDQNNAQCEILSICRLIHENKERMPELIHNIKIRYCCGDPSQCSRRWLFEAVDEKAVPPLMLPNQWEWAHQIMDEYQIQKNDQVQNNSGSSLF